MNLLGVSINHRTAPVQLREELHLSEQEIRQLISTIKDNLLSEGLVLSTCNRTEIYGVPKDGNTTYADIQAALLKHKSVEGIESGHFQNFNAQGAVKHLFSVASGIDSMLIGDNQIFKQVKDALLIAEEMQFTGLLTKRLFDTTIRVGKRAITETTISEGAVTVSYAAVQLIEKIFSNLGKKAALVIGAGETGEIAAKHLKERGIGTLAITNRTIERAEKLAEKLQAKILPFNNFKEYLHEYDIILSATSAENLILTQQNIDAAMKKRNYSSMVLMDIAIPRDIDPDSKKINYVFYNDIDSLNIIVRQNLTRRKEEIPKVESVINTEVEAFTGWYNSLEAAPTIKDLRDFFELIRADEVSKNINKFSEDDREKLEIITKRIINKILHHPTVELRKNSDSGINTDETALRINIIRELFGIDNRIEKENKN